MPLRLLRKKLYHRQGGQAPVNPNSLDLYINPRDRALLFPEDNSLGLQGLFGTSPGERGLDFPGRQLGVEDVSSRNALASLVNMLGLNNKGPQGIDILSALQKMMRRR